tara:strand:- start:536 stop:724 length:189 start_codon:yes stop_codon:yes gene_type:complete
MKQTVQSAHQRIDTLDTRVTVVETQIEERWKETILRIKRLESILIGTAGATIVLLISMTYRM